MPSAGVLGRLTPDSEELELAEGWGGREVECRNKRLKGVHLGRSKQA